MTRIMAGGTEIEYDTFGDPQDPPLVLVMGLGTQMTAWEPGFCEMLAGRGLHVVRFDNRDVGLSARFDAPPVPDLPALLGGDPSSAPYTLADMAGDTLGLFDALDIPRAHLVGASMGAMIAQEFAIRHPGRLLSLCSIMSSTGDRSVGRPTPAALGALLAPAGADRDEAVQRGVEISRAIGSPAYPAPDAVVRARVEAAYDRAFNPAGVLRQFAAVVTAEDRTEALRGVTVPTLVIHGQDDPLIDADGGKATAAAIPGALLELIPGMGHDLPPQLWPRLVAAIAANAARAA